MDSLCAAAATSSQQLLGLGSFVRSFLRSYVVWYSCESSSSSRRRDVCGTQKHINDARRADEGALCQAISTDTRRDINQYLHKAACSLLACVCMCMFAGAFSHQIIISTTVCAPLRWWWSARSSEYKANTRRIRTHTHTSKCNPAPTACNGHTVIPSSSSTSSRRRRSVQIPATVSMVCALLSAHLSK